MPGNISSEIAERGDEPLTGGGSEAPAVGQAVDMPARSDVDLTGHIRLRQGLTLIQNTPVVAVGNLVISAVLVAALSYWYARPYPLLLGWLALMWLGVGIQLSRWWGHRQLPKPNRISKTFIRRSVFWSFVFGGLWGMVGIVFFVPTSLPHQILLVFVLGGMGAAAVTTLSTVPVVAIAYVLPSMLPIIGRLAVEGELINLVMAAMLFLYTAALLFVVRITSSSLVNEVKSDLEKDVLIDQLARMRDMLEQRVAKRTAKLRETNEALQESEERLRAIVDNSPNLIYVKDIEGRYKLFNTEFKKHMGWDSDEALGTTDYDHMPSKFADVFSDHDREVIRTESVIVRENLVPHADGTMRAYIATKFPIFDMDGIIALIGGINTDITERKRAEEALERSESYFRSLIENAHDITTVLERDGTIRYESPSLRSILGYEPDELFGKYVFDLVHKDDLSEALALFTQGLENPGIPQRGTFRIRHSDGSWRDLEVVGRNLLDSPGVQGVIINSRDVSDRKKLEEQLRHAQKLEAVGQLTGGVAHEFNNILHAAIGFLALIEKKVGNDEELAELARMAGSATQRGADITRSLLAFGRKQMLKPQTIDLNEIVSDTVRMLGGTLGETIEIEALRPPDLWRAKADQSQVQSCLVNLALNARDAMPGGGKLSIETANAHVEEAFASDHSDAGPGDYVKIALTDTGTGMPPDVIVQAFDPFFTTKEVGQGTGLGLSMVYGFARQSKGFVVVDSEIGRGTRVELYLPRVLETEAQGA
jgi:PAS domain S-box-containing protein